MTSSDVSRPRVLITDDEKNIRGMLATFMEEEGFEPLEAEDGKSALKIMRQELVDVVLLDIKMPGMDGMEVLREVKKLDPTTPVIMVTGFGTVEAVVDAMKKGAFDFVMKPFDLERLGLVIKNALQNGRPRQADHLACVHIEDELSLTKVGGLNERMRGVLAAVELVAPTNFTVIISGETGTGKELVAGTIHELSRRAAASFVPVDCGSIPSGLIESELFGHEKGSFTGAESAQPGKFELASGGTLFLDEVSNLPLSVQAKLLRSLQQKQIWRIGGTEPINVDIRVVAATNENLPSLVHTKHFRSDLFHRLNEFSITVPPLRERREDIVFLAKYFLGVTARELNKDVRGISEAVLELLLHYGWPGNVRELRNVVRRAVLMADTYIRPEHLGVLGVSAGTDSWTPDTDAELIGRVPFKEIVRQNVMQVEREVLLKVLERTGGNKAQAARILQIDYKTIHKKVKKYGLSL